MQRHLEYWDAFVKEGMQEVTKLILDDPHSASELCTSLLIYRPLAAQMDGGAWWAAVYGVAQRQTQLKRRSSGSSSDD